MGEKKMRRYVGQSKDYRGRRLGKFYYADRVPDLGAEGFVGYGRPGENYTFAEFHATDNFSCGNLEPATPPDNALFELIPVAEAEAMREVCEAVEVRTAGQSSGGASYTDEHARLLEARDKYHAATKPPAPKKPTAAEIAGSTMPATHLLEHYADLTITIRDAVEAGVSNETIGGFWHRYGPKITVRKAIENGGCQAAVNASIQAVKRQEKTNV